jgi:hypothetical protein
MKSGIDRARELVPALILTLLSMIQALALEIFWSKIGASEFLWQGGWTAVIGWLQVAIVLEGILLIWVLYVSFVLRFSWLPTLEDTLLPFLIGLFEFAMIDLTEPALVGPWMMLLALVFTLAVVSSHNTMRRAEKDPANAYFFARTSMIRGWRSYRHSAVSIAGLMLVGLLLWLSNPAPWIVVVALLLALGAMFFQYLQARTYWLHSLTDDEGNEAGGA